MNYNLFISAAEKNNKPESKFELIFSQELLIENEFKKGYLQFQNISDPLQVKREKRD